MNVTKTPEGGYIYTGYLVDLWDILCQELNVTYRMLPPAPSGFGALLANGTWTGMVGQVAEKVSIKLVYVQLVLRPAYFSLNCFGLVNGSGVSLHSAQVGARRCSLSPLSDSAFVLPTAESPTTLAHPIP